MSDISTAAIPKDAHLWKRDGLDWYQEPIASTVALLKVEKFVGEIWDPACGAGNIIKACESVGYEATGSDIVCRAPSAAWFYGKHDFLGSYDFSFPKPNIITNPPFYRAKVTEAFIRNALSIATGKVAVFASLPFLASGKRARGLFTEHPPARIWILAEYLAAGNKAANGTEDWMWLVWSKTEPCAPTQLGWLR